jgi:hypothetical protein
LRLDRPSDTQGPGRPEGGAFGPANSSHAFRERSMDSSNAIRGDFAERLLHVPGLRKTGGGRRRWGPVERFLHVLGSPNTNAQPVSDDLSNHRHCVYHLQVPRFIPLTSIAQLPPVGGGAETSLWDLKLRLSKVEFHLAKDVAAFANHLGGTLLVGAEDDGRGSVAQYKPMSSDEVAAAEQAYTSAVNKRCRPRPVFDYARIPYDGGYLLAINVWPYVSALVGVSVKADQSDGFGGLSYTFPLRLTNQTTWLASDNIAMHMLPDLRRKMILLSSIPSGEAVLLCPVDGANRDVLIEQIDEATNTLHIRAVGIGGPAFVPIDDVQSVFRARTESPPHWRIRIERK